uniref:catalase n=1 Tax=Brassica oleracea TaxID=3712 RepID=A0A3P6C7Q0_BRAOL|nr:unnamed protein product [Brassica oleracea]
MLFALLLTISNISSKGFVINPIDPPPDLKGSDFSINICRAFPAKPEEMVNALGEDKTVMINLRQELKKPISLENLFEVVADDLQSMNDNLLSIVGAENPVLIFAAEQILCAGGKKMRALVNYFPSRYDPVRHAEKYPTPPAVCYGNRERCIIEKENNFKEPEDRYSSFTPERQERFIGRWIDVLSDPPITHEIRSMWISYWSQTPRLISHWDRSWQAV